MGAWEKPNDSFVILRCTKRKYSNQLLNTGSIKFNIPQSWVEYEKEECKGRGDILEGVFASCHILDIGSILHYSQLYDDVYADTIGRLVYFRRRRTMNLPCYSFYLLKVDSLETPKEEGKQKMVTKIDGKYFRDFADDISKDEDKPSVVVIHNILEFKEKIINKLMSLGLKRSEIIIYEIEYRNKNIPFHCTRKPPSELKIKDTSFSYQKEGRIIVDTNNTSIIEYLQKNPIEVGSINNISQKIDAYFPEGLMCEVTADVYKIEE